MKFVIRRTPLGFETYLFWDGALARVPEVLDLRAIPNQSLPLSDQFQVAHTIRVANASFVISDERLLVVN